MSGKRTIRPGNIAERSGQYKQVGRRGGAGKEFTVTRSEPLPPTPMGRPLVGKV